MTPPALRKQRIDDAGTRHSPESGEIDVIASGIIGYSSEDPAHPIEHLFDGSSGAQARRWMSARPDTTERIVLEFDQPQSVSRLIYDVVETERARTQEVRIEVSHDGGETYRHVLVQEYSFSPGGAAFQREDLRFDLKQVSHVRLTIVPNKSGSGTASLTSLRLFN